ncbi:MAG: aminoacyl-tRNA deacylase [Desulfovibrionaceae bacterium]|jgi:Cys-tRNA(Pro)/Cys-tRNA(Cys) deacylase
MDTTMPGGGQVACFERIMDLVAGSGVTFTLHTHQATRTMAEAEENLDFDTGRIVKTIAFASRDGGLILAALRGTRRVSYPALAGLFGLKRRDIAALSPEEVVARLGVAPGSVSPLAPYPAGTALVIDTDVLTIAPTLYCGTGRPDRTLELAPADLVRIAGGRVEGFSH